MPKVKKKNTLRIRYFLGTAFLCFPLSAYPELGEFYINNQVLNELQVINVENTPFTKKGRRVQPNLTIRLNPQLVDDDEKVSLNLNIDLEGTSHSSGSTPVVGQKKVFSSIDADVRARYQQQLSYGVDGLQAGRFTGTPTITPKNISVRNNFGLLNRIVQKKAQAKAPQQVFSELPQERRELDQKLRSEVKRGVDKAKQFIEQATVEAQSVVSQANNLPFNTKFSSKTGPQGGVRVVLSDKEDNKPVTAAPEFKKKDQIAASGVFRQEVLEKTIAQEIAGKEMKIIELKQHLCSDKIKSLINFCDTQKTNDSLGLSVVFDEKKPVEVLFQNGKVTLKINARNRVGAYQGLLDSGALLQQASVDRLPSIELEPYQVEMTYSLKDGRAKLDKLEVHDRSSATVALSKGPKGKHASAWNGVELWGQVRRAGGALMNWGTKTALESEYRGVMKDELDFPNISIPTKLKAVPQGSTNPPEILEAGSFIPMEVHVQDGWFAVSSIFCTEKTRPLGIVFDQQNRISEIQKGSPAESVGLKVGDRIDSFGTPEERHQPFFSDNQPFLNFIKEKASGKNSDQRTIEISGRNKAGESLHKTVTLCPNNLDHRQKAADLFYKEKKNPG
ncbi:MAG: hypothetical protein EB120_01625 [Proteobacteria bacterium]|nr:hypothetical protein [Pseudomonadota bacterium]NDG25858.1 hypothetical protein [Pseudomonadota bacterium]